MKNTSSPGRRIEIPEDNENTPCLKKRKKELEGGNQTPKRKQYNDNKMTANRIIFDIYPFTCALHLY